MENKIDTSFISQTWVRFKIGKLEMILFITEQFSVS